jgi:hypothetical protein
MPLDAPALFSPTAPSYQKATSELVNVTYWLDHAENPRPVGRVRRGHCAWRDMETYGTDECDGPRARDGGGHFGT